MKISVDKLCRTKVLLNKKNYQDQESRLKTIVWRHISKFQTNCTKLRSFDTGMFIKTSVFRYHAKCSKLELCPHYHENHDLLVLITLLSFCSLLHIFQKVY